MLYLFWLIPLVLALIIVIINVIIDNINKVRGNSKTVHGNFVKVTSSFILPLIYLMCCLLIALTITFPIQLLLGNVISYNFILYIYFCLFAAFALLFEYLAIFFEYCYLKKQHEKLEKELQGDFNWWIKRGIAWLIARLPSDAHIRLILYSIAVTLALISSFYKIEAPKESVDFISVIDRIIVTFIALERVMKYSYDRWFNKHDEIKKLKDARSKNLKETFQPFLEKIKSKEV